ncbi:NAD(P)-dependent alcohol dehydrogenase [Novosphingobium sp. MBES04]|uniref:NAD(P)-dependent alcohol dehydrogenase n=1 Tax=Novosphingobium sp. MBES04 TaxID=1206458 RepID=UPI00057C66B1|nr:NAD(P)-dependent alcohol dehydrogenase [Novosphingobium sp. MBES04]GAM07134.1 zinc-containing alcohol dehydrogenase superfamily protein [Novosphingobium sp. MBES04]
MRAVRFIEGGRPPEIVDIAKPEPGPGEVLLRIGGAGVCHSDLHVLDGEVPFKGPFTLGHENAGWIEALGQGVTGWKEGDAVAVYGPWGCGSCHHCQTSAENYCENHASLPTFGGGLGSDGGMAEYMIVPDPRLLVPLGDLDPAQAAPLSDAALTPYHAIRAAQAKLTPDATVLVTGIGGLGQMALQILKATCSSRIVAADISADKLETARKLGADVVVNSGSKSAEEEIRDLVGGRGVTVALDFVGAQATIDLASSLIGRDSRLTIVGLAGGTLSYNANTMPYGSQVMVPYWGTRAELIEVIALARSGQIKADIETHDLDEAVKVYDRLREGKVPGRAVLVP